jgi:hypothetical protein
MKGKSNSTLGLAVALVRIVRSGSYEAMKAQWEKALVDEGFHP